MAYEIIGTVHKISATTQIPTKSGNPFLRRSLTLMQRRYDQNTGQEFEPNFPTIDFTQKGCAELDKFKQGDVVRVRFDISGIKYNDKQTGEEKYFSSLRGFRIEPYVRTTQQPQAYTQMPQQMSQYAPQQMPQQMPQAVGYASYPQEDKMPF